MPLSDDMPDAILDSGVRDNPHRCNVPASCTFVKAINAENRPPCFRRAALRRAL
jgi:hypothetical protein